MIQTMGLQPFCFKGPHPLLRAGSQDTCVNITVSGVLNRLNYCVNSVVCTQFTIYVVKSMNVVWNGEEQHS
jgi:hypothetical protein